MGSMFKDRLEVSIFGESHGKAIGVTIGGLPAGAEVREDIIKRELDKRRAGGTIGDTKRGERDEYEILSGVKGGKTTGSPLTAVFYNKTARSGDYENTAFLPRPSHSDYAAYVKYHGYNDQNGGGHFSGRLTAPLVFAGALCEGLLCTKGIVGGAAIRRIGKETAPGFETQENLEKAIEQMNDRAFPCLDPAAEERMKEQIEAAVKGGDSVGGVAEICVIGLPVGLGEPMLESVESQIAALVYSVPGVKGLEFGAGFALGEMRGSEANDNFYMEGDRVKTKTNRSGGINGGLTNGMPLIFRAAMRPTPSIFQPQETVDLVSGQDAVLKIKGRHDGCILRRGIHGIKAAAMIALTNLMLKSGWEWQ